MNFHLTRLALVFDVLKLSCRKSVLLLPLFFLIFSCKEDQDIIDPETLNHWEYYDRASGLSDTLIWTIFQDRDGKIWVGTNGGGVNKYDGNQWSNYTVNEGLASNCVYSVAQDKDGDMWFGTEGGLNLLIGGVIYVVDTIDGEPFIPITLFHDSKQRMWAGTPGYGIVVFTGSNYSDQPISFPAKEEFNTIFAFTEDNSGTIWISTNGGAIYFKNDEFNVYDSLSGLNNNNVTFIIQDSWGDIWFGTFKGEYLTRYDGTNTEYIYMYNGYQFAYVYSMALDKKGNIWFASGPAGIVKYNGIEMYTIELPARFKDDQFICSMADEDGNIWFGTIKNGIVKYITE